jgi:catechol 2,3-dioxygenase-like lactoylglutathione lyase family enzyme
LIDHVSLGTTRYRDSVAFYSHVLAALGLQLQRDTGAEAAFGTASHWSFFLYPVPQEETVTARGMHVALGAASRAEVSGAHAAALAASAHDLWTPRERPDISATYFGAMFLDLDGHRIEVLTNAS